MKKVQSIQNFACKIITKSRKYDHVTPLLRELNWLPVDKLLYFRDACLTYKCVNNLAPDYLCNKLIKRSSIHDRKTRTHNSLQIPLFKTAYVCRLCSESLFDVGEHFVMNYSAMNLERNTMWDKLMDSLPIQKHVLHPQPRRRYLYIPIKWKLSLFYHRGT